MKKSKIKLIILLLLTTITLFTRQWSIIIILLSAATFITIAANSYYDFIQRIKPLLIISILIIIFNVFLNPATITHTEKLFLSLLTSGKIITLSLLVFAFTSTTSLKEIISIFSFLPKKFCLALTISLSIIPVILSEVKKVKIVQESKGLKFSWNPIKSFMPIIIPVIHRSFQRAEQIALILETRNIA